MKPLTQNEKWQESHALFVSEETRALAEQLDALIEEEQQAHYKYIELQKLKRELLGEILTQSDIVQGGSDQKEEVLLEEKKDLLEKINDEMDLCQFTSENAPKEIDKINFELLDESVFMGYTRLAGEKKRLAEIDVVVQELRQQLAKLYEEKFALVETSNVLNHCLHALLGKEESDRVDAIFEIASEIKEDE